MGDSLNAISRRIRRGERPITVSSDSLDKIDAWSEVNRNIALGRKNWLFAGTHDTAQNAAMIYSLFATCKKHDVNPHDWLDDILRKINDDSYEGKFSDLLPHRWKSTKL